MNDFWAWRRIGWLKIWQAFRILAEYNYQEDARRVLATREKKGGFHLGLDGAPRDPAEAEAGADVVEVRADGADLTKPDDEDERREGLL